MATDTVASLRTQLRQDAEFLTQTRAEVKELVLALRRHGQHVGCRMGHPSHGGPVMGIEADGSPSSGPRHGCTCGLRLLLSRYRSIK